MKVSCPHCQRSFELKLRKGNYTNRKANEARRKNGTLGGRKAKVSNQVLQRIFDQKVDWTATAFLRAIKNKTGQVYSLSRASIILKNLNMKLPKLLSGNLEHAETRDGFNVAFGPTRLDEEAGEAPKIRKRQS